jgi:hypothetical protein
VATTIIVTDEFRRWYEDLSIEEQLSVERYVEMLALAGAALTYPYSSGIKNSRFPSMRELRIQHAGRPYRVLYAFDPIRQAVLLVGGEKTGQDRWYESAIRLADRLFDEYLQGDEPPPKG